jgi:hypothetical protein
MVISTANIWMVLVATLVSFVIGWIWFGPLFGKKWMKDMAFSEAEMAKMKAKGMMTPMILQLIAFFVMTLVFVSLASALNLVGFSALGCLAFWLWLGFEVPMIIGMNLWGGKPWSTFWISSAQNIVTLLVTALIYSYWG